MSTKKNLEIKRAITQTVTIRATDAQSMDAINEGAKILFTVKPTYDDDETDSAAVIAKTELAKDVLDTTTGTITFTITAAESNVTAGRYVYDIILKQKDGDRIPLLEGKLKVTPTATLREIG